MLLLLLLVPALAFAQTGSRFERPEAVIERYLWEHPEPGFAALPEELRGYYLRLRRESARWVKDWPDSAAAWTSYALARAKRSPSAPVVHPDWLRAALPLPPLPPTEFRGRITLVNVWATWCEPCRAELPQFQKIFEELNGRTDVRLLTLNVDSDPATAARFLRERGYSLPFVPAKSFIMDQLGVNEFPQTWIVDAGGIVRLRHGAFAGDPKRWSNQLFDILAGFR